jgi:hypothetical protein
MKTLSSFGLAALLLTLLFVSATPARLVNWTTVNVPLGNCSFQFPQGYHLEPGEQQAFYSAQADNLTFQMQCVNSANLVSVATAASRTRLASAMPDDRLNLFVTYLAQATRGQVISQYSMYTQNRLGREVELTYAEPESDQTTRMVVRFYWINDVMYVFALSAPTQHTNALRIARNTLFNSIIFY